MGSPVVLIVDDTPANLDVLRLMLESEGYKASIATSGQAALKIATGIRPALILLDIIMPGIDGFETCRQLKETPVTRDIPVIFITAQDATESVVEAFAVGGVDYIAKPFKEQEVIARVKTHLTINRLARELSAKNDALEQTNEDLRQAIAKRQQAEEARARADQRLSLSAQREAQRWGIEGFIAKSQTMQKILGEVNRLQAAGTISVLVTGESGTGKELIARAIHFGGPRAEHGFIPVNCSAIPRELAESEFFGHVKGAFTGAAADRKGHFELADGGTLFLDEIGDMPTDLQAKLLRVLEDGCITPVGGTQEKRVDVRVLAATNADLQTKIDAGAFRGDLYFRLAQFTVVIPPLRHRKEDIPLLAQHFLALFAKDMGVPKPSLSEEVLAALEAHPFPGNVRELKNILVRALIESNGESIQPQHLHFVSSTSPADSPAMPSAPSAAEIPQNLDEAVTYLIRRTLEQTDGNIKEAAELLGVSRQRIYRHLDRKI